MIGKIGVTHSEEVLRYYDECWVKRFRHGHNPLSHAMHMGYFETGTEDNDRAKLRMNAFLESRLPLHAGAQQTVVDAGCGMGGTAIYLAERYPSAAFVGINISESQITLARQYHTDNDNRGQIDFRCEDYCETSLPTESVDAVYAVESVCHAEDKRRFFAEALRILKPGGTLLVLDYINTGLHADAPEVKSRMDDFTEGWAVNEYIRQGDGEVYAGFAQVSHLSLTDKIRPGVLLSHQKAQKSLADSPEGYNEEVYTKHLKACVALKELMDLGVVDYRLLTCIKA